MGDSEYDNTVALRSIDNSEGKVFDEDAPRALEAREPVRGKAIERSVAASTAAVNRAPDLAICSCSGDLPEEIRGGQAQGSERGSPRAAPNAHPVVIAP